MISLLRASGRRCCTRTSQAASLTAVNQRVASARYMADDASTDSVAGSATEATTETAGQTAPKISKIRWSPKGTTKIITKKYKWIAKRPENIQVSRDIFIAMSRKMPIVGLETAIYTHGFPKPDNFDLALEMEEMVRANGAVPATIGILNGQIYVGMTKDQLKELTESAGSENTIKISQRDIAYSVGQLGPPMNGGTTIAATIKIAALSGIRVVATGGLGGVHKGGESSMDVSADLAVLGREKINLVTSGMKSFLDTARTLEYLETQGVFVSTFGKRGEKVDIPGFYSRESGHPSPHVVESPEEAGRIAFYSDMLKLDSGNVFFNPIPEEFEIPKSEMDPIIESAVEKSKSITGKDNTPAVLNEILKQTEGRSVAANRQLVLNNAKIGAQLAVHIRKYEDELVDAKMAKKLEGAKKKATVDTLKKSVPRKEQDAQPTSDTSETSTTPGIGGNLVRPSIGATGRNSAGSYPDISGTRSYSTATTSKEESLKRAVFSDADNTKSTRKANLNQSTESTEVRKVANAAGKPVAQFSDTPDTGGILVVGGVGVDYVGTFTHKRLQKASAPGNIKLSVGGVAKNVAATIQQIGEGNTPVRFLTAVGKDSAGLMVLQDLKRIGLSVEDVEVKENSRTAGYMALHERRSGNLALALSDAQIVYNIRPERVVAAIEKYQPEIVCFDLNLHIDTIEALCKTAKANGAIVVCEPTSALKIHKLGALLQKFEPYPNHFIDILAPNELEMRELEKHSIYKAQTEPSWLQQGRQYHDLLSNHYINAINRFIQELNDRLPGSRVVQRPYTDQMAYFMCKGATLLPAIPTVLIKLGAAGVITIRAVEKPDPSDNKAHRAYAYSQQFIDTRINRNIPPMPGQYITTNLFLPIPKVKSQENHILGIAINWTAAEAIHKSVPLNSNGAGDTFLGAFVEGLYAREEYKESSIVASPWLYYKRESMHTLITKGQTAAAATLRSTESHYMAPAAASALMVDDSADEIWGRAAETFGKLEFSQEKDLLEVDQIPEPPKPTQEQLDEEAKERRSISGSQEAKQ
ncbi:hypothetical protein TWF696_000964 [Orbilia brochopaga]|uniref:Carbohydrate kinase PfkB domain-containing protein n=1 Tax=Orbilia brochopaga TaxID=3140254 RepID=A0AAV9VDE6_9PEZI